jgi:hypothetical protein
MVNPNKHTTLNLEHAVASEVFQSFTSTTLTGHSKYTVVIASKHNTSELIILQWDQLIE